MSTHYEIAEPTSIYEHVDGEVLVLNLETGLYTQMKGLSASVFDSLAMGVEMQTVRQAMVAAGCSIADIDAVETRTARWCELGYLRPSRGEPSNRDLNFKPGDLYDEQTWDDLSELIKLDPVHDVSPQGWPQSLT